MPINCFKIELEVPNFFAEKIAYQKRILQWLKCSMRQLTHTCDVYSLV